jgi:hypothetical protein
MDRCLPVAQVPVTDTVTHRELTAAEHHLLDPMPASGLGGLGELGGPRGRRRNLGSG